MTIDTQLTELIINTLSPEQMPEHPSDTEIYLVEDDAEYATVEELETYHDTTKQDKLLSGTNIKTINGESILGAGNIDIKSALPTYIEETETLRFGGV